MMVANDNARARVSVERLAYIRAVGVALAVLVVSIFVGAFG